MWIGAGLASAELTFLSRFRATSGATNRQRFFLFGCHDYIMQRCPATSCSIVTTACAREPVAFLAVARAVSSFRCRNVESHFEGDTLEESGSPH
jgi:hypothetical protein